MAKQAKGAPRGAAVKVRAEAGEASGMVFLWLGDILAVKDQAAIKLTPEQAKRLAIELESAVTTVWSEQRRRRQEIERSASCGD